MKSNSDTTASKDPVSGQFVKGNGGGGRRERGQPNKITRDLKEGIIDAAVSLGEDGRGKGGLSGYLKMLAKRYPKQFSSLLGRLLPLQVNGNNLGQFIGAVNIVAVPNGKFLTVEDAAARLAPAEPGVFVGTPPNDNIIQLNGEVHHDDDDDDDEQLA